MRFKFKIGTKIIFGKDCVKENKEEIRKFGKRALIVTGKNSARVSGALCDVEKVLSELGAEYSIYDGVENNPSLENVSEGGRIASKYKADFIIGIGGGSPLDAAKAIAVLGVNRIEAVDLYLNTFKNMPLPIIAIPTTSGTGSEVTPYSILTRKDMQTKMSFGNDDTFPKLAFLDAAYTESMSLDVTINTAVDAFSHAAEGYLGKRSTEVSDIFAVEAIDIFGQCLMNLLGNEIDHATRERLLYMSMLGGLVVTHTGTTILHGMGYSLTYFKEIPHGKANGLLMKEYLRFNYDQTRGKIDNILKLLRVQSIDEFGSIMDKLLQKDLQLSKDEIALYAALTMKKRSTFNNAREVTEKDLEGILERSL